MVASDSLGPQFGKFDPSGSYYGGVDSEFRYSRVSPSGENKTNSRGIANMLGQNRSEDLQVGVPTGATTDFRAPSRQGQEPDYSNRFKPAEIQDSARWS